ncbi:MAG: prephenate dehydrogenase/arogenate dehydrogenase family protein [Candidatus Dadabacteria bacterium]|nr:prephenate dehydrogenase/arogenate dehydrogenase family protein [Candidatus Dadabacteria bacterium]NIT13522.1 prephenate dehydrogenase/arogenate dehydrogenase family protein [Candidatus Dadabacteria bacterium]
MWRLTGCKVVRLSPERHDEIFAHVSHLPHIAAFSLVNSLLERDKSFFDYLGGGLKDFSRIAESSADMWVDIFISNKEQVLDAVGNYKKSLNDIEKCISEGDRKTLKKILEAVNSIRKSSV